MSQSGDPGQESEDFPLLRRSLRAMQAELAGLSAVLDGLALAVPPDDMPAPAAPQANFPRTEMPSPGTLSPGTPSPEALAPAPVPPGPALARLRRHVEAMARLVEAAETQAQRLDGRAPGPGQGLLGGQRILLAVEAWSLRQGLAVLFSQEGADVIVAASGTEALALLSGAAFDLLITDASLTDLPGARVIAALRGLKDARSTTPALAMTADLTVQIYDALIAAGATRVVTKPLPDGPELLRIASRLVKARAKAAPPPPPLPSETARTAEPTAPVAGVGAALPAFDPAPLTRVLQLAGPLAAREILDRLMLDLLETLANVDRIGAAQAAGGVGADLAALRATTQVLIALAGTAGAPQLLQRVQALDHRLQTDSQILAAPELARLLDDIGVLTREAVAAIAGLSLPAPDGGILP